MDYVGWQQIIDRINESIATLETIILQARVSRRERIATEVMAAIAPTYENRRAEAYEHGVDAAAHSAAHDAIAWADALIAELDKEKT